MSCSDVLLQNMRAQVQNMDIKINFLRQQKTYKQAWLNLNNSKQQKVNDGRNWLNEVYKDGFYVRNSYPGINAGDLAAAGIVDVGLWYKSHIVADNGILANCPAGGSATCVQLTDVPQRLYSVEALYAAR